MCPDHVLNCCVVFQGVRSSSAEWREDFRYDVNTNSSSRGCWENESELFTVSLTFDSLLLLLLLLLQQQRKWRSLPAGCRRSLWWPQSVCSVTPSRLYVSNQTERSGNSRWLSWQQHVFLLVFQRTWAACGPTGYVERVNCTRSNKDEHKRWESCVCEDAPVCHPEWDLLPRDDLTFSVSSILTTPPKHVCPPAVAPLWWRNISSGSLRRPCWLWHLCLAPWWSPANAGSTALPLRRSAARSSPSRTAETPPGPEPSVVFFFNTEAAFYQQLGHWRHTEVQLGPGLK